MYKLAGGLVAVVTLVGLLASCGAEDEKNGVVKVFKSDNSKQCEGEGISVNDMRLELTSKGIDVLCGQKSNTGMAHIALCGSATGNINVYTIRSSNLPDAERLGFNSVKDLQEYKDSVCTP